jgi:class 3 adenylate cyclase
MPGGTDPFWKERELLQAAREILESIPEDASISRAHYQKLVSAYATLLKQSAQLTRFGDDQQKRLHIIRERLQRYVSAPLAKKILSGKEKVEINSTRRVKLSIFFSDIVGFSWHSSKMEGEALSAILNSYLEEMTNIINQYGGTLDKYIGDAIMVFFGDPDFTDDYDHARRCVSMALQMRSAMQSLREQWFSLGYPEPLHVRMGIATGFVSVGNFGSSERMDYTIIGAPANLAARLQAEAEEDQILISHETWGFVKNYVRCSEPKSYPLKGFFIPQLGYEVIGLKDSTPATEAVLEDKERGITLRWDPSRAGKQALREFIDNLDDDLHS